MANSKTKTLWSTNGRAPDSRDLETKLAAALKRIDALEKPAA